MDNSPHNRKPWISALSPEEAQHELNILGDGSWSPDKVNEYWIDYSSHSYKQDDEFDSPLSWAWAASENYAMGLADDHGVEDLIEYLRAIVKIKEDAEYRELWGALACADPPPHPWPARSS